MSLPSRYILGMKVHSGTYAACTDQIQSWAKDKKAKYVCVANVHMTMETVDSKAFKEVVNHADLVTSDGMPLVWMLRRLGLPESERVYGPELVLRVCQMAEREGLNIGLFGGTDASLKSFKSFLSVRFPQLNVSYSWAPPFRPLTEDEDQTVQRDVAASNTHILFVGIGCPKQERWMAAHKHSIQAVQIGVGAAFDFHSGSIRQAPKWMGNAGLEWLFRLTMEPKRLWRRYVVHNPRFIVGALFQLTRAKIGPVAALLVLLPWVLAGSFSPDRVSQTYWVSQYNPVANDSNPGTKELPFKTISTPIGLDLLEPGDSLLIESGVYREEIRPKRGGAGPSGRVFIGAADGHHVVVSGADVFGQPAPYSDSLWVIDNYNPLGFYGSDSTYERELIVADGATLNPVFQFSDLRIGTFFVDRASESDARIFIHTGTVAPSGAPIVEISRRGSLFKPGSEWTDCGDENAPGWFYVKNITFVHAANQAQAGAVCLGTEGSVLDSVRVEWTNGLGIQVLGRHHELFDSKSNHNGQAGINGTCRNCLLERNETSYNNRVGHDPFWESGGGKWIGSQGLTIRYHTSIGNEGPGIWFDGDNYDVHVSYSSFENNLAAGVMVELKSEKVFIEHVSIKGTRRHGWTGSGVLIQAAGNVVIEQSDISENDGAGIWVRADDRFEGGFNRFLDNRFSGNGLVTGVDQADIQIEARDIIHLCSNQIRPLDFEAESTSIYFEVADPYDVIEGDEASRHACLVRY